MTDRDALIERVSQRLKLRAAETPSVSTVRLSLEDVAALISLASPSVPETVYKAVERVLDENSAWIARPDADVTRKVAMAAGIAWQMYTDSLASTSPAQMENPTAKIGPFGLDESFVQRLERGEHLPDFLSAIESPSPAQWPEDWHMADRLQSLLNPDEMHPVGCSSWTSDAMAFLELVSSTALASPSPAPEDVVERMVEAFKAAEIQQEREAAWECDFTPDIRWSMRAALATLPPPEDAWRPIETADKHDTVLLWGPEIDAVMRGSPAHWPQATHWRPLPAPPGQVSVPPTDERVKGLVSALNEAREQFLYYAKRHRNKTPPDTDRAAINEEMAARMEAALTSYRGGE